MLFRFSLYGFLKNQAYFEPFLVLYFVEKGLSFLDIGIAIGVREFVANLMQVPTGALADLYGRRRCMIASFVVYILSFLILSAGTQFWHILLGISFFGSGDAFRGGTHKAMILDWLRAQGRESERTKVYGYTRSWSKMGSALSVIIASALVFVTASYKYIFISAVIPYVLNLINLATYPRFLDGNRKSNVSLRDVASHLWQVTRDSIRRPILRRLLTESMCFGGIYEAVKDYLQPLLKLAALSLPLWVGMADKQRSAILVGAVYFLLHLLGSYSSRKSHRFMERFGNDDKASSRLWIYIASAYALMFPLLYFQWNAGVIFLFILLASAQNIWRPMLISRFDAHSDPAIGATLLSVESQASSLATLLIAPLLGKAIDAANAALSTAADRHFWPVALFGLVPAALIVILNRRNTEKIA